MVFSEDMADAFCRALNDWLAKEWLDKDARLRGSIVIPVQSVEKSVAEIERCARDQRFVQVLMLVMGDMPLGKRAYWPIYAAAERLGLPIGIHAGSNYHNPPTSVGWGSYHIEDYVAQAQAFQTQLTSLIVEGVFARHPNLKMVMLESGFTWLPSYLWRLHKFWRGMRMETPWVDRAPLEIVRSNIRFSLQPVDAPPDPRDVKSPVRPYAVGRIAPILDRLSALAIRRRRGAARGDFARSGAQDHDRQPARDLYAPEAAGRPRRRRHERAVPRPPGAGLVRSASRPRSPIATSIRRARRRPSSIPISPSAGTRISKPTASIPIRA